MKLQFNVVIPRLYFQAGNSYSFEKMVECNINSAFYLRTLSLSGLPIDLQYLPEDKQRETDPDIRRMLIDAIMLVTFARFMPSYFYHFEHH